ncbi:Crp/Fnr family transcriptional regulator [Sphingobium estronivorans]|uniref:Crp/Fnr family transcriptional regulator n=1 Tax=Sphingobium estronivorans TaxID=1577690 RepID=UPI00123B1571|nr:Crp/Fnr family transcriptional regulator [Sphingobium estronivorans]
MLHNPLLKKLASVDHLTETEEQAAMALCHDVRAIPRRKDIVSEGTSPDRIHIILEGWAARYNVLPDGSRRITAFLLPGDFCEIHATVLKKMDHSIIALTDCQVAFVSPEQINSIAGSTPSLARAFWRSTLIDEAILRRWLVKGGRSDAFEAVGHLLGELYVRARLVGLTSDHSLEMPLTQEEIGDATGLTPVHVNRVLKRLREFELATIKGGTLRINNIEALRQESGFNPDYLHLSVYDSRP